MDHVQQLLGRPVEVCTGGCRYRGVLVEVAEEYLILRGPTRWHQIPLERVADVRPAHSARNPPERP